MSMVMLQHVVAPERVAAGRGYSQAVTGRGRSVAASGQIAQHERGEPVGLEAGPSTASRKASTSVSAAMAFAVGLPAP